MTAMHIAASALSLRNGKWMQSATATAGWVLRACFSVANLSYCGPSDVTSTLSTADDDVVDAAVFNNGSLISVPITYESHPQMAEKYFPSPHPTSATMDPLGKFSKNAVAPGQSTPRLPRV